MLYLSGCKIQFKREEAHSQGNLIPESNGIKFTKTFLLKFG